MNNYDAIRQQLDQLLRDTARREVDLTRGEQQLAKATEQQSQDRAVVAAYLTGGADMKRNALTLIDDHLSSVERTSMQAALLRSLRDAVRELR